MQSKTHTLLITSDYYPDKAKLFVIDMDLAEKDLLHLAKLMTNTVSHAYHLDSLAVLSSDALFVSRKKGVTDDEGRNLQIIIEEIFLDDYAFEAIKEKKPQFVYSMDVIQGRALKIGEYNPVIYQVDSTFPERVYDNFSGLDLIETASKVVEKINLDISDGELLALSEKRHLALDLKEMLAIKKEWLLPLNIEKREKVGLGNYITDCELEVLAQTWSEHCKHKEFSACIDYHDLDTGKREKIDGLFDTYIKKATEVVDKNFGKDNFLIKVFSDNSGVVKLDEEHVFTFKVETHNSPSAIDPYGGAITGILGNNRDPLGTGKGGGRLLFNTDVLCFARKDYDKPLLSKQLHPAIIQEGVIKGIRDGGNKSGIPTINGAIVYDDRFAGKPLVFCGTGGIMPKSYLEENSWDKKIEGGYLIYMLGGRVGKDGIHGATFSSRQLDEQSPASAVQIGSPITQKIASDFLKVATERGLVSATTDNGAGGLSSSVGELAEISHGARVYLERVPLKYHGLKPWEIFVSESQERFTLAIHPNMASELEALAKAYSVELTAIGEFTDNGVLDIRYRDEVVGYLDMDFLHDGVPKKQLHAEWKTPFLKKTQIKNTDIDFLDLTKKLLASDNIKSRESIIRQYDHEVQGNTVLKPLMGETRKAPQDAGVIRLSPDSNKGIIVSNGINPKYSDLHAYHMSASAFDEAIRSIISVGGFLPTKDSFWSVNDNFCVPNSVFDEETNPDGRYKLAQVVQMNKALYDVATYFNIPFTSGKDSMKNDFYGDGVKISIPPTILYSIASFMPDINGLVSSNLKQSGDLIYQLGETYDELGGSECFHFLKENSGKPPKVRLKKAKELYEKVMLANQKSLIASSHDISDGGMLIALIETVFGDEKLGVNIDISMLPVFDDESVNHKGNKELIKLFSESNSRFIVSVAKNNKQCFESIMGKRAFLLGEVTKDAKIQIFSKGNTLIKCDKTVFLRAWES